MQIDIHNGKGEKDRTVMLPKAAIELLKQQITYAGTLYAMDKQNNELGVEVPFAL